MMTYLDEADEDWVDDEGDDDPESDVLACPSCRAPVHEETQQCPNCGDWITPVYPGGTSKRWIFLIVVVFMIISMLMIAVL